MDNAKALQRFKAYLRRRYPDRRTPIDYISDIRQFQLSCSKSWDKVKVKDLDRFVDQMHRKNLKPTTITRRVMALKVYFDFMANDTSNFNHPNPVHLKRHAAKLGRHLPRDLSDADVTRLWNILASPRDRALVALMWHAGLRVAEVVGLTLDDVIPFPAPEAATSRLPAYLRVLGKGQKERVVYLNQETLTVLQAWQAVRPQVLHRMLFVNERGHPLRTNGVQWLFTTYGEKLGLHLTPHRLRHTFARQLIEAQMPVESLASLMGHAQISTTQIYLVGADPAVRQTYEQAMQRLEKVAASQPSESLSQPNASTTVRAGKTARPTEPHYPPVPKGTTWATDLPQAIRQACLAHIQRLLPHWRASYRTKNAKMMLWEFEQFFRFVLKRHKLKTVFELTPEDLRAYIDHLQKRNMKGISVRSRLHYPLSLLRTLAEQGKPIAPALLRVERPPLSDALPRALSELEAQRLELRARQWLTQNTPEAACDAACYFLLAHTGIRTCELLDLRKEGPAYDLPIAVGLLMASEQLSADLSRALIIGELSLDGIVRHTNGVLPMAALACEKGFDTLFVPAADAPEAALVPDLNVYPIETLFALVMHIQQMQPIAPYRPAHDFTPETAPSYATNFSEVRGQEHV